jgi:ATP-binding cassette subfamily B protein AbcA/BmrA
MKDIAYQYNTNEGAVTIEIPDFYIRKGEKLCITGESGQGKTTLLKILSGMIETDGKLFVDENAISKNIDAVYIAQDTEMLDMTLRDNLVFGNTSISDETLIKMLMEVGLYDWYTKQDKGLDTLLGERGVFVSTGQRQRLNILRGLLIEKEIYLLDEPTSNVDEVTEEKMIRLIQERLEGKTVIIVTHKENIREICDREYYFIDSRIIEA